MIDLAKRPPPGAAIHTTDRPLLVTIEMLAAASEAGKKLRRQHLAEEMGLLLAERDRLQAEAKARRDAWRPTEYDRDAVREFAEAMDANHNRRMDIMLRITDIMGELL